MVDTVKLSNRYLSYMDSCNDERGIKSRLGAKGGLILSFAPSILAATGHTVTGTTKLFVVTPLKCAAKVLSFGYLNVGLKGTLNSIKENYANSLRFLVATVAIPIFAIFSSSSSVKIGELVGLTDRYAQKWKITNEAAAKAIELHENCKSVRKKIVYIEFRLGLLKGEKTAWTAHNLNKYEKADHERSGILKQIEQLKSQDSSKRCLSRLLCSNHSKIKTLRKKKDELSSFCKPLAEDLCQINLNIRKSRNEEKDIKIEFRNARTEYHDQAELTHKLNAKLRRNDLYATISNIGNRIFTKKTGK